MAGRPPSISFIEKNIGAAPRADVYVHLNLVTRLPWEKFEILIYCVGASRSFPFPFASHYALLLVSIGTSTSRENSVKCGHQLMQYSSQLG